MGKLERWIVKFAFASNVWTRISSYEVTVHWATFLLAR